MKGKTMGRPPLPNALSPAERQRRHRQRRSVEYRLMLAALKSVVAGYSEKTGMLSARAIAKVRKVLTRIAGA
jgi:hypothetical protein